MSRFWLISPEVPAELDEGTVLDTRVRPWVVSKLDLLFQGWLGDDLMECFPVFFVTHRLAEELRRSGLSGFALGVAKVRRSELFMELYPGRKLSTMHWLQVAGRAGEDDFGVRAPGELVVSDRALTLLRLFAIAQAEIQAID